MMFTVIIRVRSVENGRCILSRGCEGLMHRCLERRVAGDALKLPRNICLGRFKF